MIPVKSCLIFSVFLMIIVQTVYCQISDSAFYRRQQYQYYQVKAKNQGRAALALFGVGLVVSAYSAVHVINNLFNDKSEAAAIGLLVGGGLELGGLALAFASGRNRKKANTFQASAGMQSASFSNRLSLHKVYYPTVSLKFHL